MSFTNSVMDKKYSYQCEEEHTEAARTKKWENIQKLEFSTLKRFLLFQKRAKKMQNCINVTSLAAFQSADLLLNAVSESLRTGSGISKTLKDNRKIRGHFGFRTFEKKKTTARNGFSSTIQNDMPHTQNLPCLLQLSGHPNSANYSSKPRGSRSADTSFLFLFFFADT